jgi:hypothetical protein
MINAVMEIAMVAKSLVFLVLRPQKERITRITNEIRGSKTAIKGRPIKKDSIKPKSSPNMAQKTMA